MSEKEIQQKYIELQLLNARINQLSNQLSLLDQQLLALRILGDGIKNIREFKTGSEILVPLGEGIFVSGKLEDSKKVLINVGNGVVVERSIDEAREMVENQISELQLLIGQFDSEINDSAIRSQMIQKELAERSKEH